MNHVHMPLPELLKKRICHMNYWDNTLFIQTTIKYLQPLIYVLTTSMTSKQGNRLLKYRALRVIMVME